MGLELSHSLRAAASHRPIEFRIASQTHKSIAFISVYPCSFVVSTQSFRIMLPVIQIGTTAIQPWVPKRALNFSARRSAALIFSAMAKVVEPLPDMRETTAPLAIKNSW
jgi:hypothetical protein